MQRHPTLKLVESGNIPLREAAQRIGVSYPHCFAQNFANGLRADPHSLASTRLSSEREGESRRHRRATRTDAPAGGPWFFGMAALIPGSWFGLNQRPCCWTVSMDDATGEVLVARFFPFEGALGYLCLLRQMTGGAGHEHPADSPRLYG